MYLYTYVLTKLVTIQVMGCSTQLIFAKQGFTIIEHTITTCGTCTVYILVLCTCTCVLTVTS